MKKLYFLLIWLLLVSFKLSAQVITNETFENTANAPENSSSFISNGQLFTITNQVGPPVAVRTSTIPNSYGWNGTAPDLRYFDNLGNVNGVHPKFTISSLTAFKIKSFWLFLSDISVNQYGDGGGRQVTVVAKNGSTEVFTYIKNSGFLTGNPSTVNNGFVLFDFTGIAASSNPITSLEVTLAGTGFDYFNLDAFRWESLASATVPVVTTSVQTNLGATSVTLGGTASDGGSALQSHGVVWSYTDTTPTIGEPGVNNVVINGTASPFSQSITSLLTSTTIYFSAYAINSVGTSYGNTRSFTTNAALSATQSQTNPTCNNGSNGTATVTPAGGKTPYTYSWTLSGGTTATLTGLAAGSYSVQITDGEGTSITKIFTINNPAATPVSFTTNPASVSVCTGSGITLSSAASNATSYQWYVSTAVGNTFTAITNNATYSNATTASLSIGSITAGMNGYRYYVVASNTCASATSSDATLTVTTIPVATATPSSENICRGNSTNIVLTSAPTGATFAWTVSTTGTVTGAVAGSGSSIAQALDGLGTATYTVTPTLNGCPGSPITVVITVKPLPIAIATPSSKTICSGTSPNIALTSSPAGASFAWTVATASGTVSGSSAGSGSSINQTLTGNGIVNYTVTPTLNGCPGTPITIAITVNPLPTATATPASQSICTGTDTNIALTSTPTGATFAWTVATTGTVTGASAGSGSSIAQTLNGIGTATYTITPTLNGCPGATTSVVITVKPLPSATATPASATICSGSATNIALTSSPAGSSFAWTVATTGTVTGALAGSGSSIAQTLNGTGTATYTITPTLNSCPGTPVTVVVTVNALPAITSAPSDASICVGESTVFTALASAATSYQWQVSTGGTYTNITNNATYSGAQTTTLTITGATVGMNNYRYQLVASGSCSGTAISAYATLNVNTITATQGAIVNVSCRGEATGSATVNVTGGSSNYTYSWAPSGGTAATASGLTAGTYTVTVFDGNCSTTQIFPITQPAAILAASTASTGVSCFGGSNGSASVTATGGTPGYTYAWSPLGGTGSSISGRPAGNYQCIITDSNGCTITKNVTIATPSQLSVTMSKTNVSCNNGSNGTATATVTGGTGSYTYTWTPTGGNSATATGLTAGTYIVIVRDANNCQTTQSVTVDQPALLTATSSKTDVLCNGGSTGTATATPSGGNGGYVYVWRNASNTVVGTAATATGLPIGNYTCTITDSVGCFTTLNVTINQPSLLVASTVQTSATCASGGQATVIPNGGAAGYTYLWSPTGATTSSISGLAAGVYTCTITDANGCSIIKNFTITTTNTLVASTFKTDVSCNGSNTGSAGVVPSGAPGPFTYTWSPSGGSADTATGLTAGNYSVLITAANGCSITKSFTITQPTALTVTPSQDNLICNGGSNGTASVTVTGGTGAYTYLWAPTGGTAATASGLTAGTYTVTIKDANLCQTTQSITITQPSAITSVIASQTNVSCNGGTNGAATITPSGGTGAYSYLWAPSGGTAATANGLAAGTYTVTIKDANLCQATQTVTIAEPASLTATISKTDVLCNNSANGTATVVPSGGTAPYTYSWSPSGGTAATATNLSPATYTCTITDNKGCFITRTITITEPAAGLTVTAGPQTNVLCHGAATGTATVNVTGGTGAYTYVWAPTGGTSATATGLTAGTYTVTVKDANLCTATQSFTITEPAQLTVSAGPQTNILCNGAATGSATVNVTGGTGAYTYVWAPTGGTSATATGLTAGTYTVTVKDANLCTTTQSFTITEPAQLTVLAGQQTNVLCHGAATGSATVNVTGGTGAYTYIWAPTGGTAATATGLIAGTYTVTVKDANLCTTTQSFTITEPATSLTLTAGAQTNIFCSGAATGSATVVATGGTGAYTYSWAPSGGTAATATGLAGGTYTVTVTDANGCTATQSFTITQTPSIVLNGTSTNISCFGGANGAATVSVIGGTAPYIYAWSSGATTNMISGLNAGVYTCTVTDANGCTATSSFTIYEQPQIMATSVKTNVSCYGLANGSAAIIATGGVPGYSYAWSNGAGGASVTGLAAGTYTVNITDTNGCSIVHTVIIDQPEEFELNATVTNISCSGNNDGSIEAIASGGTEPYTYVWSPDLGTTNSVEGLGTGEYSLTVTDANGCSVEESFTITQPTPLSVSISQTNVSCYLAGDGELGVAVTGGTGPYTYAWTPNVSTEATAAGLAAGNYSVTITDANGCSTLRNFSITQPLELNAAVTSTAPQCVGETDGTATVIATGGTAPYTYEWSNGGTSSTVEDLAAGTYNVSVTDAHGCVKTVTLTITAPLAVTISLQPQDMTITEGENAAFTVVATNAASYQWQVTTDGTIWTNVTNGGTNPTYSGATLASLIVTDVPQSFDGYAYRAVLTNNTGCTTTSDPALLNVSELVGTVDFKDIRLTVYPNPASTEVFIKLPDFSSHNNIKAVLYDLNGRMVQQNNVTSETFSMNVTGLESAVYILNITSDTGTATKRIVVDKKFQ
ncbi:PKD-like domain-containing protein [Flavobacterium sp. DG1-102-2]|uniref:PKD-like domain-containing protein n=1 Tax=Flavobacterium sp. DG1-102-2 TaxID=3081663 RepID=UPI00294A631F|nr:PKD-like domain-containing protein [Flavobacterium sp. DG1-102-2]MDV6166885.1 PKD-like domain-containing protein [Flavobacterium sp. DG1-102-2]